jgi:hypothetical protein
VIISGKRAVKRPIEKPAMKEKEKPPTVARAKIARASRYARSRKRVPSSVPTRNRASDPQTMAPSRSASVPMVWFIDLRYWKITAILLKSAKFASKSALSTQY